MIIVRSLGISVILSVKDSFSNLGNSYAPPAFKSLREDMNFLRSEKMWTQLHHEEWADCRLSAEIL